MAYQVIENDGKRKLVQVSPADVLLRFVESGRLPTPTDREPHQLNAIRNRLVELEQTVAEMQEAIAQLEGKVDRNRQDYDDHLTLGTAGSAIATALFLGAIAWVAWVGGLFSV